MTPPLLEARRVTRHFPGPPRGMWRRRLPLRAVGECSLILNGGEVVGLVGESGSGKSTLGRMLAGLLPPSGGRVLFRGTPLEALDRSGRRAFHRAVQLVFQDPFAALNPRRTVGESLIRPWCDLDGLSPRTARQGIGELMARVGLEPELAGHFPHQLSGGQAQRVVIARALASRPRLLILDEPVSALDVSIQAQILELLRGLQRESGMGMVLISHDLAVVEQLAGWVVVMRAGELVERGECATLLRHPAHPYTRQLIRAVPVWRANNGDAPPDGDPGA